VLNFIYYPVSAILWFWHYVFGTLLGLGPSNGFAWALSVIFLVYSLRALLFKPFVHQVRSMRKMQEFAPEIKKLQQKHGSDKQKLAQEMQKLQSEHGVNPLGGCLPMLVQIPVFIGLFHVLRSFKPGWGEVYVFDKVGVDSFVNAKLFGASLSSYIGMKSNELQAFGTTRAAVIYVSVPLMIVASIATHFTARHSVEHQTAAAAANPQTAMMNKVTLYLFPLGVLVGGAFFPLAILLYWLSNNTWTLGQQYVVYRRIDREEAEKKTAAVEQRQALAPKPGQKPSQAPKPGQKPVQRPAQKPVARQAQDTKPSASQDKKPSQAQDKKPSASQDNKPSQAQDKKPAAAVNGQAVESTDLDQAATKDDEIPGVILDRSRGKRPSRKRR
jgi:YidC/Oxa1 family membrane protein insertase